MAIVRRFIGRTHKENESITDCQDYVQPPDHVQPDEANTCFAIADGASQSFYPSIWAEFLVEKFCKDPEIEQKGWEEWLKPIQEEWSSKVKKRVEQAKSEGSPIWVTNQNRLNSRVPATSTFIGLQFLENQNKVKVSIVGDSCLFIVKGHKLQETHPLKESSAFNDRPEYFASYANHNEYSPKFFDIPLNYEESPEPLHFILATDALSEYIFKCVENKEDIFKVLLGITSSQNFENFVSQARSSSSIKMKNDDVALIILSVSNATILESPSPPKKTTKGDSEAFISEPFKEEVNSNKIEKLKKQNNSLKKQRSILGVLAIVFLLVFVEKTISNLKQGTLPITTANTELIKTFKTTRLPKTTVVYKDKELKKTKTVIDSSSNLLEVLIIEEGDKWIKFETTLYAHESIVSKCGSCTENEFEIQSNEDIRVVYTNESKLDNAIFGQLKDPTKFENLEFQYPPNWYKFKLVGYIKKEDIK